MMTKMIASKEAQENYTQVVFNQNTLLLIIRNAHLTGRIVYVHARGEVSPQLENLKAIFLI